jgi:hypothetical protein
LALSVTRLVWTSRNRCYDFSKIFSSKNLAKILAFFVQTTASYCKKMINTLVFENLFLPKFGKNRRNFRS